MPNFVYDIAQAQDLPAPNPGLQFIPSMLRGGITLVRALSDIDISDVSKFLIGADTVYEFGGDSFYYKEKMISSQKYLVTGNSNNCEINIDMTKMSLADNSIEAGFSAFALEHVSDYPKFVAELERVLKPGGRFLLVVPFMYCFHAAPNDYVRFTKSYLEYLFQNWNIALSLNIGNRSVIAAEMYNEKPWMKLRSGTIKRTLLQVLSVICSLHYILSPSRCEAFPSAVLVLVERKNSDCSD